MQANGPSKAATPAEAQPANGQTAPSRKSKQEEDRITSHKITDLKVNHFLTVAFFAWLFIIHAIGIFFFTKGFLLTRLVLDHKSECSVYPTDLDIATNSDPSKGCWHPKKFDKAVVLIIDALRYDFTIPFETSQHDEAAHYYHDSIPVLYDTAVKSPSNAFLRPFIADPPTTTLQRLKGLTTGTLPTFIDAGSNFAGTAIEEDNIIDQWKDQDRRLVHLGDDTWHALFPHHFVPELTHPYDSFNVWDLHTVDSGVIEHIFPLLRPDNSSQWDILFGHCLGVDHAGHRYGPDHSAMKEKLQQMDRFIRDLINEIDDSTLLVVMGDHGMDSKGDHGGESDDEVEAALWMYSKKPVFGRAQHEYVTPPKDAKTRPVAQIDLVPTLALLLGIPVPFNNLGMPIEEAFLGPRGNDWSNLATVSGLTAAQIKRYQKEYDAARSVEEDANTKALWTTAEQQWTASKKSFASSSSQREAYEAFRNYQNETLRRCKSLWASFSKPDMIGGIALLAASLLFVIVFARGVKGDLTAMKLSVLKHGIIGGSGGAIVGAVLSVAIPTVPLTSAALFLGAFASILYAMTGFFFSKKPVTLPIPRSIWSWMGLVFTISQGIGFASNSYTIWEDEILLFFLVSFGVVAAISSMRQENPQDRVLGVYHSILFVALTRIASLSRLCREEQIPYCKSTFYASSTTSLSAPWQLLIPFMSAMVLPSIIKAYYQSTLSYQGSAILWIGTAFRMALLIVACYWTLDAINNAGWYPKWLSWVLYPESIQIIQITLAKIVFGMAFAVGTVTFLWAKPCINISIEGQENPVVEEADESTVLKSEPSKPTITILGYANPLGTHYLILVTALFLPLVLLLPPMGQLSMAILLWSILSLLEILDTNALTPSTSPLNSTSSIGPLVLALLGSFHFFKTGHTATLSSIQWNSAFIPFTTIHYPWSPILVTLNSFAPQILCAIAVPLLVLWKRPVNHGRSPQYPNYPTWSRALLTDVSIAVAGYLTYFATISLCTTMWAGWLRRHLMVYRVFGPRFMVGAAVLGVVDIVATLIGVGLVRWTISSVGDVFGY